ncbi:hypothetical protein MKZ38_007646 [Zalerion maritima]|uniref:Uncharacterized protein n=1 Tax=Zalerion maritima TaxID=339359 RepID=A0AAD5S067_9PEZI|nr:hypothetical protein MKZ38_007646 [Zalerion maritima]
MHFLLALAFAALASANGMCIIDPTAEAPEVGTPYAMCDTMCVADTDTECVSPLGCADNQICWGGVCKDKIDASVCCEDGLFSDDAAETLCS